MYLVNFAIIPMNYIKYAYTIIKIKLSDGLANLISYYTNCKRKSKQREIMRLIKKIRHI